MKHRRLGLLFLLALSLLGFFVLFGCGGAMPDVPEVKDMTITAEEGMLGKTGALHRVSYTAPEGCTITTSVQLGGAPATAADFACDENGYRFYTTGEYTVTVYAAKDGMLGSASASLTVTGGVFLDGVELTAAAGEEYGKVGALHVLHYTAAAGSTVAVKIEKDGSLAENVDFRAESGTLVFGSVGQYTVTVTATLGETSAEKSAQIEIAAADPPAVTLTLDKTRLKEDEALTLSRSAVCSVGDEVLSEQLSALYRKGSTGTFREADAYTVIGDRFIPHAAGEWRLVYSVQSKGGAMGESTATFTCEPAELALLSLATGRQRITTKSAAEVDYLVQGAVDKYDVSFDTHGNKNVTAVKGTGTSVRVTALTVDYFTVTVVYTHKVSSSVKKTLDIDFYSVESLTYAPVWGEDPFDGMPSDVLTSMGHLLYFDAAPRLGAYEYSAQDASFEVIEHNVTASSGSNAVEILFAAGNREYPYLIVSNFDNNVATGNFTLKMTLTDPYTHYSAVATKKFNVLATTNDNARAAAFIEDFVERHPDFYHMGDMDYSNLCSDCRHNMVLTKTGTIMQRTNPYWTLNNNNADFASIAPKGPSANNRLEFRFRLLAPNPTSREVWLGIGLRTQTKNGWAGFFDLHGVNGRLAVTCEMPGVKAEYAQGVEMPAATDGASLLLRIDRRVSGDVAEYTVYVGTDGSAAYRQYCRFLFTASSSAGNAGAPVAEYQFTHRNAGGCYAVEDVTLIEFA